MSNSFGRWLTSLNGHTPTETEHPKAARPDDWYTGKGYEKCIICGEWVKNLNVGFVHAVCNRCEVEQLSSRIE